MEIRRFQDTDAVPLAEMIAETLRTTNIHDYTPEQMEEVIRTLSPEVLKERAAGGHSYVVTDGEMSIGCGTIAPYWGSLTESIFLTIFVKPAYQKKGIGRKIIETLEQDEYFLRAVRVEIPASKTAADFYRKFGYANKQGFDSSQPHLHIPLEKFCAPKGENV